jgi:hypothetical protein
VPESTSEDTLSISDWSILLSAFGHHFPQPTMELRMKMLWFRGTRDAGGQLDMTETGRHLCWPVSVMPGLMIKAILQTQLAQVS